jgi:hypothetical protein
MMPFQPDPEWYEKHWFAEKPEKANKAPWKVASALTTFVALVVTLWRG